MKKRVEVIAALLACSVCITSTGCAGKKNKEPHELKLQSVELGTEKQTQADTEKPQTESQTEQTSEIAEKTEEKDERIDLLEYCGLDTPEDVIEMTGLSMETTYEEDYAFYTGYDNSVAIGAYPNPGDYFIALFGNDAPVTIGGVSIGMPIADACTLWDSIGCTEISEEDGVVNYSVVKNITMRIEVDNNGQVTTITISKKTMDTSDNTQTDTGYIDVYGALVNAVNDTYGSGCWYHLYDIDGNGTPELILLEGTCEADYNYYVYTYEDGNAVQLGTLLGSRLFYEVPDQNGVISVRGKQGYQFVDQITISGDKLIENELFSGEASDDGYYANEYEIPYYYVNDLSGIQ